MKDLLLALLLPFAFIMMAIVFFAGAWTNRKSRRGGHYDL